MMDNEKVDLVFSGELVPGADLAQVKQNLSRLFKMDLARVELLFTGKPVTLKRNVDMDAAGKYRIAMKKAGARVSTVPSAKTAKAPSAGVQQEAANSGEQRLGTSPERSDPAPSFSLAPAGESLLRSDEKVQQVAVAVDISGLSLKPAGEALLDASEREVFVPLPIDLAGLDLAPVGADVLRSEERQTVVPADVDTRHLSVAKPGERLAPPASPPPPPPDVSRITLAPADEPRAAR